jgi:uncharacterized protein (TIGR00299 family) protein
MRTVAFDGQMGASGDMVMGALVAAGADPAVLDTVEAALDVTYRIETVVEHGIAATSVTVVHDDAEATAGGHSRDHEDGGHDRGHASEGHGPSRTYPEVLDLVDGMDLPAGARATARDTFEVLAEAEAAVHGTGIEDTHFHEVGADDAVADVAGAALLLADLDPDEVVVTPVSAGGGEATFSHGTYPVPVPAVVEIAERADWELRGGPVEAELLTPTGAALFAATARGVEALPAMAVGASGYGAGSRSFDRPNVLRATVGERRGDLRREEVVVLETNLDDATPEVLGSLQETLAAAGARDVSVVPLTMKKSRPGHLVKVVARPADERRVARRLAEETGTLGVRASGTSHRWVADRAVRTVEVDIDGRTFEVSVKVAADADGERYDASAEYDDALAVARETGLPVREVLRRAENAL